MHVYIYIYIHSYIYTYTYCYVFHAYEYLYIHTLVLEAWVLSSEHLLPVVQGAELSEAHWTEPF